MAKTAIIFGWDVRTCPPGHPARGHADQISGNDTEAFMEAFFDGVEEVKASGVDLDVTFIVGGNSDDANIEIINSALAKKTYDVVLVGNGLRGLPDVRFFERAINAVHQGAPSARIVFNNTPYDNPETIARGFQ
jgi:hypothetical protein